MKKILILTLSICGNVYANTGINIDSKIDTNNQSINMNDLATIREQSENTSIEDVTSQLSSDKQELIYSSINNDDLSKVEELESSIDTSNLTDEQKNTIAQESNDKGDDECGIWLCLPQGFITSACSGPHRAMIKRILRHKSALPSFASCSKNANVSVADDNAQISSNEGIAAFIPKHKVKDKCIKYNMTSSFYGGPQQICAEYSYKWVEDSYIRGAYCIHGERGTTTPKGCTKTVNYAEIKINNETFGEPYYFEVK